MLGCEPTTANTLPSPPERPFRVHLGWIPQAPGAEPEAQTRHHPVARERSPRSELLPHGRRCGLVALPCPDATEETVRMCHLRLLLLSLLLFLFLALLRCRRVRAGGGGLHARRAALLCSPSRGQRLRLSAWRGSATASSTSLSALVPMQPECLLRLHPL